MRPIIATYRLQLRGPAADPTGQGRAFTFADAQETIPYLKSLGVSHLYLSPILTSPLDSAHGYNVTDPTSVNPQLGGLPGLRALAAAAKAEGMGIIVDIVPNHLGVDEARLNPWWWDVLTYGKDSPYERFFDVDWHRNNGAEGKLGLPILGSPEDLNPGEGCALSLQEADPQLFPHAQPGDVVLAYYDNYFPVRPGTCSGINDDPLSVYARQVYRLMYWRDGVISYRRFFSVNGLAGVRQEDPDVFRATHRVVEQMIDEDLIDGVRVDHPDGLADPFRYLKRLRRLIGPERWLVIEKILEADEPLDPRLSVDGTTGYDALRELDGVFVTRQSEDSMSMLALQQSGSTWDEHTVAATAAELKREVARTELGAEVDRLARAMRRDNFSTAGSNVSEETLRETIVELVAAMPVYRADYLSLSRLTATVIADMSRRFPSRRPALDLVAAALIAGGETATRFAQVCGAVMAKGVEDTLFYRACRLVSLQEVGGDPGRFGVSPAEFHLLQWERASLWPRTMTTLTTHDTKRSEDTRARIVELAEIPTDFAELVRSVTAVTPCPDPATGLFLLQNLVGIWPADGTVSDELRERFHGYAVKALREAGRLSTWTDQNSDAEGSILAWIDALFDGPAAQQISRFVARIHPGSIAVSLGRKALQLLAAGIPDIYQGTEYLDYSLVDPDNRRFVDYQERARSLAKASASIRPGWAHVYEHPNEVKQRVVATCLQVRREFPECFVGGDHQAVFAEGRRSSHVLGIARGEGASGAARDIDVTEPPKLKVIALAVRRPIVLEESGGWDNTTITLPEGDWVERLTGRGFSGEVAADLLFGDYPVAVLTATDHVR